MLRVPDESAGTQAKCPICSLTSPVPTAQGTPEPPEVSPQPDTANPYASPQTYPDFETHTAQGSIRHGFIDAELAIKTAWELFKVNVALLVGAHVIMIVINMVVSVLAAVAQFAIVVVQGEESLAPIFINILSSVATNVLQIFLGIGIVRINLNVGRGKPAEIGMLFSGGPFFVRILGGSILYGLLISIGLVALIIPGVYLALKYWPFYYFIVDRDCGVGDSFSLAGEYTTGNKLNSFWLFLISLGLATVGMLMCCVGAILTYPIASLMWAVGYLMMTSQPVHHPDQIQL